MRGLVSILTFLFIGVLTAIYIGFGNPGNSEPRAIDQELEGLNEKYVLRFSHVVAESTPKGLAATLFAQLVREKTDGWVEVQVFPNAMLFEAQEEFYALLKNEVQMIAPALSEVTVIDPNWHVMDLPYIFKNEQMVEDAFQGRLGQLLFESISEYGLHGLAYWENSFKQLTNAIRPVIEPTDLADLTVRVMPSEALKDTYRILGAKPRVFPFNEVYDVLSTGIVDGTENTLSNIYSKGFYQQQNYMTISNHNYLGYAVFVNTDYWNALPVEYQKSIIEALNEVKIWLRDHSKKINQEMLWKIEQTGSIQIHYQTENEKKLWREAFQPVYDKYNKMISDDIIKEVNKLQENENQIR